MPARAITPKMLQLMIVAKGDDFQIEIIGAFDERCHGLNVCAESGALAPLLIALVVAPPVLDLASYRDAQLEVANVILISSRRIGLQSYTAGYRLRSQMSGQLSIPFQRRYPATSAASGRRRALPLARNSPACRNATG